MSCPQIFLSLLFFLCGCGNSCFLCQIGSPRRGWAERVILLPYLWSPTSALPFFFEDLNLEIGALISSSGLFFISQLSGRSFSCLRIFHFFLRYLQFVLSCCPFSLFVGSTPFPPTSTEMSAPFPFGMRLPIRGVACAHDDVFSCVFPLRLRIKSSPLRVLPTSFEHFNYPRSPDPFSPLFLQNIGTCSPPVGPPQ